MDKSLQQAKEKLDEFFEENHTKEGKPYEISKGYLQWVAKKTEYVKNEKSFSVPDGIQIKRGMVFWAELGHNIDQEYGGRHPVVVLRVGGSTAIVIPLSTQEPTEAQMNSGIYAEIDRVYEFTRMRRWVNVLNATPISIQRFDFKGKIGNIKGYELNKINRAMAASKLWR